MTLTKLGNPDAAADGVLEAFDVDDVARSASSTNTWRGGSATTSWHCSNRHGWA
jgi:hypothetical protein